MKKVLLLLLALGVIGAGVGYYMYNKPVASLENKKADVAVTAAQLIADYESDEQAADQKYLGKVVQVSGKIVEMTTFGHNSETYDVDDSVTADFGGIFSSGAGIHLTAGGEDGMIKFLTGRNDIGWSFERMRLTSVGNLGLGTTDPVARLQVADGDVYIQDINNGVIMKSPDGASWRMTINNNGSVKTTSITCPD